MIPAPPDDAAARRLRRPAGPRASAGGRTAPLLGGSPLRLLRLLPRARALLAGDRLAVRDATSADARRRGCSTPGSPIPDLPAPAADDVTVVIPVRDRPAGARPPAGGAARGPGHGGAAGGRRRRRLGGAGACRGGVRGGAARGRPGPGRGAQRRAAGGGRPRSSPSWTPTACRGPAGSSGCGRTSTTRGWRWWPRGSSRCAGGAGLAQRLRERGQRARHGGASRRRSGRCRRSPTCPAPRCWPAGRRSGDGFDEAMRVAEDVDLVWRLAAAGLAGALRAGAPRSPTSTRPRTAEWLRRRAFYGTGAALLAARHGSAVAPLVLAPESAAAWALALVGGRRGARRRPGCSAVTAVRLARRLARPGEPLPLASRRGPRPARAGRLRPGAGPRGHPPPLAARARRGRGVSRRARRAVLAVAVADAVAAWWPHRHRVGPVRFAAGPAAGGPRLRRRAVVGRRPRPRARGPCSRAAAR